MTWQEMMKGGFGVGDAKFAVHLDDEKRAKEAIKAAKAAGASFDDLEKEILWHCYKVGMQYEFLGHVGDQVKTAKRLWK